MKLIELGKLIKECGGKSQIYAAKPRNDKFNQINCWIKEINKKLNSKNAIDFIYDISKEDLLFKYFYNENISKEISKYNLEIDFTKFNLLQDKIYKIKEGFYTEFVRIFTQLAYIKLIETKKSFSIFNFNDLIKTVENSIISNGFLNLNSELIFPLILDVNFL